MWSSDSCRQGVPFSYALGDYNHNDNAFLLFNYNDWCALFSKYNLEMLEI